MTTPCRRFASRPANIALVAVVATIAACDRGALPAAWNQETGFRWRPLTVAGGGQPGFTRMDATGIRFQNTVSDSALLASRIVGQGAGIALGDVDGDGLVDVFLARTEGCSALYRNRGGWRFEDVTTAAGVGACDRYSTGSTFADTDGDGDLDLVLVATRGPNVVFVNDGKGKFTERRDLGLDATGKGGTTVALADIDGNGTLDLYVANYKPYNIDDSLPPQQRSFNQVVRQTGPNQYEVAPEHRGEYKLVMRPDMGGLRMTTRGATDDFYLNEGGRFTRVPMTSDRFRDAAGKPLAEEPESFTLGAKLVDLNGDGAPDLYLANDFEDTDQLWFNDGRGTFRLADWTAQRQISNSAMGVDVADVNGDGMPDLFEVDMLSNDSHRLKTQMPTHTALPKRPGDIETQLQQQRNALFINRGDGTFAEASLYAGVQASGWSWSHDVPRRRSRRVAGHPRRERTSVGHHGRRHAGASAEPAQRRVVASTALGVPEASAQERGVPQSRRPHVRGRERARGDSERRRTSRTRSPRAISTATAISTSSSIGSGRRRCVLRNDATAARVAVRLIG